MKLSCIEQVPRCARMRLSLLLLPFLHLHTSVGSVHLERIGPVSVSKNCDNKPCFQGKCVGDKCRCFAGWGGQQCDRCYGRSLLTNESEVLTDGPRNYSSSSRCMWVIDAPQSQGPLLLKLDSFVTECSWDHVYVYDGLGVYGQQLAAYSGTMSGVELSVASGKALVYFFSDLAFNMPGFNMSFAHNRCLADCSLHGVCEHGVCQCEHGYQGTACQHRVCTHNLTALPDAEACSYAGVCRSDLACQCNKRYHGDRCQAPTTEAVIDTVLPRGGALGARASHASVLGNHSVIWVVGGAHFSGSDYSMVMLYHIPEARWRTVATKNTPQPRYDHSLVKYKNKLYMFGGVVAERNISNELWSLDMTSLEWTLEKVGDVGPEAVPSAVAGHTAHVIANEMFIFYGYNPYQGYMHRIQKYNFANRRWLEVLDKGAQLQGRFGHSLVAYGRDKKEVVLLYGGYMPPSDAAYSTITDSLVQYTCSSEGCVHKTLSSGIAAVFRHSASLLNGMMLVVGGNGHNESTSTRTHDCYSTLIQAYDVECDSWSSVSVRDAALLERYGHSSLATSSLLFITGGFSGVMLDDVIKFTPAECGDLKRPAECRSMRQGIRCLQSGGQCVAVQSDVSYPQSFASVLKNEPKTELDCPYNYPKSKSWCSEKEQCDECLALDGCSWCNWTGECVIAENTCKDGTAPIAQPSRCSRDERRPCAYAHDCFSCTRMAHCTWFLMNDSKWKCISTHETQVEGERSRALAVLGTARNASACPSACAMHEHCELCIQQQCMWCPTNQRCVSMDAYMVSFPYGQCQSWITAVSTVSNQHACQWDPSDCSKQKTCAECERVGPKCGWCDDGSGTGLGTCLAGSLQAPLNASLCPNDGKASWHFTNCSACQCNGHSNCTSRKNTHDGFAEQWCSQCTRNTTGDHCQLCADGFYGDPRNGGHCEECHCNGQATTCQRDTGDCFCTTKGVTGKNCSKCEQKYYGDPQNNQPCYYELTVDFIFTFKLDQDDPKDKYVNQINFFSTPHKRDTDVQFTVVCESPVGHKAYVSMSINSSLFEGHAGMSKPLMARTVCDDNGIRRTYSANSEPGFVFGTDANTTFLVKVHNFSTPIKIQISFSQSPPINWVLFFVIFAACFVVLLVVAGLLWMIKLRIEVFRRNQRRYDEIEQMASRPFASVRLELASSRVNLMATPIAVEPCSNYRAGVFTVAVRLPTGGRQFTPHGTSGLAVASALCLLTQAQLGVLQAPDTTEHQLNRKTTLMRYIPFIRS